jgi:hypothetical protein
MGFPDPVPQCPNVHVFALGAKRFLADKSTLLKSVAHQPQIGKRSSYFLRLV